ncbi:MAG: class I SAM-dependent methyltransferase [Methylococcales bacterium]|nr:class I SAM-dependent methyltransferase [Methylococcales bacterium]MDD5755061.1 class I SAM-dependent methyltransferase [Methylococcales bacterium]
MNYEEIRNYWEGRAAGDNTAQSTTQDIFLREIELDVLKNKVKRYAPSSVADVGCGDGRTTFGLASVFEAVRFFGFDYSLSMIGNAKTIVDNDAKNIVFSQSDICNGLIDNFDLIYTTRCLINLPSWDLQKKALINIHNALSDKGIYLMIENFVDGQNNFNNIRKDFGLSEIPIRDHNLYFERENLISFACDFFNIEEEINISSTYYLVSRVIYSKICDDSSVTPDYFDKHHQYAAGLPFCGEYGPVRLICFRKKVLA